MADPTGDLTPIEVRKLSYPTWVHVVDGVPKCPCCQEPTVERDGGWVCAIGSAALDLLAGAVAQLDQDLTTTEETS